ncbi:response regulator transcription factor [Thalassobaculum sp. OXR-137]|uniref:response regulator transcription factor n=1 Tax=Thalassobaculum sp. OXR-137 TaxID=3100173 RepID=UPI002AC8E89B|nr:response regulator transcription factor [Thalassobaculum sp. OXR-137]WPZ32738.1 response regulator transcription factor [Thalassobaculum sp. OXR-137]
MDDHKDTGLAVIVVEDEDAIREEVCDYLSRHGFSVRGVADGGGLERMLQDAPADVIVLDLGLPHEDGIEIAKRLRRQRISIGIVVTTARSRVEDRILGYETGADVYLVKPVNYAELAAVIAALKRHRDQRPAADQGPAEMAWQLDLATWRLMTPTGAAMRLTRAEMKVMDLLSRTPGAPVMRHLIGRHMGKSDQLRDHRYVDQLVSRLRRKVITELGWEAPIGSAQGEGYFVPGSFHRLGEPTGPL